MYSIEQIKGIVRPIAQRHGIEKVWLFGSYARREQTENSDIDFLIERGDICSGIQLGAFYADLQDALNVDIDVVTIQSLSKDFLQSIEDDEVMIYAK